MAVAWRWGLLRTSVGLVLLFSSFTMSSALERTAVRASEDRSGRDWAAGTTCTTSYFNTCNGWLWIWGGWHDDDRVGMLVEPCCQETSGATLVATTYHAWTGAYSGRGYTGVASIYTADANGCPQTLLANQELLVRTGDNVVLWGLPVSQPIVMVYDFRGVYGEQPIVFPTDHPAAGPTGPAACGTCYPTDRVPHSFDYGNATTVLCPGSPLDDGTCNAEWLYWAASFACHPTSVDASSWGALKNLYR